MSTELKILIAEDDVFIRKAYEISLKAKNINAIFAEDGIEAFEKARDQKPSIILLDLFMPKKDGLETLKDLKFDSLTKDIPVIIFSNSEEEGIVSKVLAAGAREFIVKSNISIEELLEKIYEYVL